jgi:spore germination cell wall hydrolase CwlJ-like protein
MLAACVIVIGVTVATGVSETTDESESLRCLALTMYWESRSDGREGMFAVGWVVLNRLRSAEYPKTVCAVVRQGGEHKGCQFSYWCDGADDAPKPSEAWDAAQQVARVLLTNPPPDPTNGALFYHAASVSPVWAKQLQQTARIGKHIYYRKA